MAGLDNYVKLLMHMDEDPFRDHGPSGHVITNNSSVVCSAAQSKFGGYSALFNGTNFLSAPDSSDFDFAGGDFTIDFWVNANDISGTEALVSGRSGDNYTGFTVLQYNADIRFYGTSNGANWNMFSSGYLFCGNVTAGTWYHVAITRSGDDWDGYINGVLGETENVAGTLVNPPNFSVGSDNGSNPYSGYIDEVRISKGIARWTSAFTPPTKAYSRLTTFQLGLWQPRITPGG